MPRDPPVTSAALPASEIMCPPRMWIESDYRDYEANVPPSKDSVQMRAGALRVAAAVTKSRNSACAKGSVSAMRSGCHCTPMTRFASLAHSTASTTPSGRATRRAGRVRAPGPTGDANCSPPLRSPGDLASRDPGSIGDGMERLRLALSVVPVVLNLRAQLAGDVLHQRAAQKHIQALDAVADGEKRLLFARACSSSAKSVRSRSGSAAAVSGCLGAE